MQSREAFTYTYIYSLNNISRLREEYQTNKHVRYMYSISVPEMYLPIT